MKAAVLILAVLVGLVGCQWDGLLEVKVRPDLEGIEIPVDADPCFEWGMTFDPVRLRCVEVSPVGVDVYPVR